MRSVRAAVFFLSVLIAVFILLAVRCFYLQNLRRQYFSHLSAAQQEGVIHHSPQRGVILDCRGRLLAASCQIQTVFAEPRNIKKPKSVSARVSEILDMPAHKICRTIVESKNPGYVVLKRGATEKQCEAARKIYGLGIRSEWKRNYPADSLACHVIGFTGDDNHGLAGVELRCDKDLAGSAGQTLFFADLHRRPIRAKQIASSVKDGWGVILTIDSAIQQFTKTALEKQYKNYNAESAVAVVARPKTGEILAMVSLPDFNPNNIRSAKTDCLKNRAVTDAFEPGSLLKPVTAAIAIDAGAVKKNEKIFCERGNYSGKGFGRLTEYENHSFADLTVGEIIVHSSNIGMAKIGQRTGAEKLYRGLSLFGFGQKSGIDLPGEQPGLLRTPEKWTGYSITRIPFGQEISTTAIQIIRAFCILANKGRMVRPFVVKAIVDRDGGIRQMIQPAMQVGYVVRPQLADWLVKKVLVDVVNEGTGQRAKLKHWQVFGKTGTAQMASPGTKGYLQNDYVASFVAGAPAREPQLIVLVSVIKPDLTLGKGYTGGTVAAPVAAEILRKALNYLDVPKREVLRETQL